MVKLSRSLVISADYFKPLRGKFEFILDLPNSIALLCEGVCQWYFPGTTPLKLTFAFHEIMMKEVTSHLIKVNPKLF